MSAELLANDMVIFSLVVEHNGFTAAARVMKVPKVRITRSVAFLEEQLGTRLLERTTRRIHITDAGRAVLAHCQRIAAESEAARAVLVPVAAGVSLRISLDNGYGRALIAPLVSRFLQTSPDIVLRLLHPGEPEAHLFDVQLRADGRLAPTEVAVSLGNPPLLLCASPAYMAGHTLRIPAELASHALLWATTAQQPVLRLGKGGGTVELRCTPRLSSADPLQLHAAVVAGLGIGVLPEFMCRSGLSTRRLVRVMPDWKILDCLDLQAVSPADRASEPVVRNFVRFLKAHAVPALAGA